MLHNRFVGQYLIADVRHDLAHGVFQTHAPCLHMMAQSIRQFLHPVAIHIILYNTLIFYFIFYIR